MLGFIGSFQKLMFKKSTILRRLSPKRIRARYNSEIRDIFVPPIDPPCLDYPETSEILVQVPKNWYEQVNRYLGRHCDCCNREPMATQERDALELFFWDDEIQNAEVEEEMLHQGMILQSSWSPLSEDSW